MNISINIVGNEEARKAFIKMQMGVRSAANTKVKVGSDLPYAYGIEMGFRRSGRLARRAGPALFLHGAIDRANETMNRIMRGADLRTLNWPDTIKFLGLKLQDYADYILVQEVYNRPIPHSKTGRPLWERTGNLRASLYTASRAR